MADAAPPKRLGKYRPIKKLGAGGMGVVYLAEDTELGRTVALKVLPKRPDMAANLIARFRSEARSAARLSHPGIVTVFDSGETDRALYIALEYVDGKDVDRLLKTRERLPPKRATDLVRQIAEALVHLHEKGIVHRDIKPSNIMVRRDGSAVLADLGLARAVEEEAEGGITRAGYTVGTVDYMAPEQAKNSRDADIRSDLYSLGCSWFHMLTGRIPFPGDSITAKLSAHDHEKIPDPRSLHGDIPDSYTAVLHRAMAKKPGDRYATPQEFLDDLELAQRRRGNVSSDLLKDLAAEDDGGPDDGGPDDGGPGDGGSDDSIGAMLIAQERAAEARAIGDDEEDEDEEDAAPPGARRRRKPRRTTRKAGSSGSRRVPGESPAAAAKAGNADEDGGGSSPKRRKPAGDPKDYKKGLDPILVRNLVIGGALLVVLVGLGLLTAKFSGAFGGPAQIVERPKSEETPDDAPVAPPVDQPDPEATLVRDAGGVPKPPPAPEDPAAPPAWAADVPAADAPVRGPEAIVVAGAADPNPANDPRADTLAAALARLPEAGGTVTLRGPGPFTLPRYELPEGADVRLRGEGEAIVNAAAPVGSDGWLRLRGGSLTVEGLHVLLPETGGRGRDGAGPPPALIEAVGATVTFRGGSVTARGDAPAVVVRAVGDRQTPARALLDGATLRGAALTAVSLAGGPADLFAKDCLLACGDGPALALPTFVADDSAPAAVPRPTPRGGQIRFISRRAPGSRRATARNAPAVAGRSARFVDCSGVFGRAAVTAEPGSNDAVAVTLAGGAFGAAPGAEGVALLAPPDAAIAWTVKNVTLAGLELPPSLSAPVRPEGWPGEPIGRYAALDPARFTPAELTGARVGAAPRWDVPTAAARGRADAAAGLPREPTPWATLFPDGSVIEAEGARVDAVLGKTHPDGATVVLTGGGRVRLGPVSVSGRSLRIVGRADEDGNTPLIAASSGAGDEPLFRAVGGRLELVNLTLEARPDRTGAGPLVAADDAGALVVLTRCELRAGADDAPALRVRRGAAALSGTLLLGEGGRGLIELDRGGVALNRCGLLTPGPAVRFDPDGGGGAVGLRRCAVSVGGPAFDAKGLSGGGGSPPAVALTERCLFLPPPPPGAGGRVALSAGPTAVWGAANAFATAYNPPPKLREEDPLPGGGERDARTGAAAIVLKSPKIPDWKTATAAALLPNPGTAAATDGLGAGEEVGPAAAVEVAGVPSGPPPKSGGSAEPRRPTLAPDF